MAAGRGGRNPRLCNNEMNGGGRAAVKYKVVLKKTEEGYSVCCPGLPGCWSQGETEEEALRNIQSAIEEYLAAIEDSLGDADVREVLVSV